MTRLASDPGAKEEDNVRGSLPLAGRGHVLDNGRVAQTGRGRDLPGNEHIKRAYLGL
jgi:branched-chain amino acid transport system ATP-binding protein